MAISSPNSTPRLTLHEFDLYVNMMIYKLKKFGSHMTPVQWRSQKKVTDEDENRNISAAETLKTLDEVKNFIEVIGSDHLNKVFNELIEHVEQMKLKNKKKVILEVF